MSAQGDGHRTARPTPARRGGWHRLGTAVIVLLLAGSVAMWASRWVDTTWWVAAVVQSVVPMAAIAVVGATVIAALARRRRLAIVGLVASALVAVVSVPGFWPRSVPPNGSELVVLASNLEFGQGRVDRVVELVRQRRVDVLVLVEATPEVAERLDRLGIATDLPYAASAPASGASGAVLRSRYPLTELDRSALPDGSHLLGRVGARVQTPSGPVTVLSVHTWPPSGRSSAWRWHDGLTEIGQWAATQPTDVPLVLAGDFNASADHPVMRSATAGFIEAHAEAGRGWVRTWPQRGFSVAPFVQIDHVLARCVAGVVDAGTELVGETDHAAVWATLRLR